MVIAFLLSAIFTTSSSLPTMLLVTAIFCVAAAVVLIVVVRRPGPFEAPHLAGPLAHSHQDETQLGPHAETLAPHADASAAHADALAARDDAAAAHADTPAAHADAHAAHADPLAARNDAAAAHADASVHSGSGSPLRPDRGALAAAWGDPLIRRLCVLALFPFGVFVAMSTFAQALLEPAGVTGGTASTILLVNVIAGVLGSAIIPILVVRRRAESAHLVVSLTVTALACVLLAVAPGVLTGFVAITLIGLLLLPALPIVLELVERRTGEAEGTAAGLIWMSGNLGGLIVAVVVGLLVDHPLAAFLVMAAIALIAVPGARALRRPIAELRSQSQP
jgi:hypothetical protein